MYQIALFTYAHTTIILPIPNSLWSDPCLFNLKKTINMMIQKRWNIGNISLFIHILQQQQKIFLCTSCLFFLVTETTTVLDVHFYAWIFVHSLSFLYKHCSKTDTKKNKWQNL